MINPMYACRMKPSYMGPDSPVKREFMEFCAAQPMDSEPTPPQSLPCMLTPA